MRSLIDGVLGLFQGIQGHYGEAFTHNSMDDAILLMKMRSQMIRED
jgi:membrane-anchored protein YejM (alkaline phosphatase superfamily)